MFRATIAVIGSRTFTNKQLLFAMLDGFPGLFTLVSGGARGADSFAEVYAKIHDIPIKVFKPDWDRHGKAAGFIRNKLIIDEADHVVACWDGISKGTKHGIDLANKAGVPVQIIWD